MVNILIGVVVRKLAAACFVAVSALLLVAYANGVDAACGPTSLVSGGRTRRDVSPSFASNSSSYFAYFKHFGVRFASAAPAVGSPFSCDRLSVAASTDVTIGNADAPAIAADPTSLIHDSCEYHGELTFTGPVGSSAYLTNALFVIRNTTIHERLFFSASLVLGPGCSIIIDGCRAIGGITLASFVADDVAFAALIVNTQIAATFIVEPSAHLHSGAVVTLRDSRLHGLDLGLFGGRIDMDNSNVFDPAGASGVGNIDVTFHTASAGSVLCIRGGLSGFHVRISAMEDLDDTVLNVSDSEGIVRFELGVANIANNLTFGFTNVSCQNDIQFAINGLVGSDVLFRNVNAITDAGTLTIGLTGMANSTVAVDSISGQQTVDIAVDGASHTTLLLSNWANIPNTMLMLSGELRNSRLPSLTNVSVAGMYVTVFGVAVDGVSMCLDGILTEFISLEFHSMQPAEAEGSVIRLSHVRTESIRASISGLDFGSSLGVANIDAVSADFTFPGRLTLADLSDIAVEYLYVSPSNALIKQTLILRNIFARNAPTFVFSYFVLVGSELTFQNLTSPQIEIGDTNGFFGNLDFNSVAIDSTIRFENVRANEGGDSISAMVIRPLLLVNASLAIVQSVFAATNAIALSIEGLLLMEGSAAVIDGCTFEAAGVGAASLVISAPAPNTGDVNPDGVTFPESHPDGVIFSELPELLLARPKGFIDRSVPSLVTLRRNAFFGPRTYLAFVNASLDLDASNKFSAEAELTTILYAAPEGLDWAALPSYGDHFPLGRIAINGARYLDPSSGFAPAKIVIALSGLPGFAVVLDNSNISHLLVSSGAAMADALFSLRGVAASSVAFMGSLGPRARIIVEGGSITSSALAPSPWGG